jgi:hypothetical protein
MSTLSVDTIQGKTTAGTVAMPSGSVVQVTMTESHGVTLTTTSESMVASGVTATITPKFNTSKIFILCSFTATSSTSNAIVGTAYKMYRSIGGGSDAVVTGMASSTQAGFLEYNSNASSYNHSVATFTNQDSPSTTSEITYKLFLKRQNSSNTAAVQRDWGGVHIQLLEIKQ